ncbi:MAG: hypothetical protein J6X11_13690 [Treponema sp.]|nr:hypothetical protein [Treponema sp.]
MLSIPKESPTLTTKIKSVTVKDKNLYLVYQVMDKDKTVVATLKVDFVCSKYKNAGYCFISAISIENHLKFNKLAYTCSNPNTYPREHGQCLGTLLEMVRGFFTDEVALNKQREAENKKREEEAKRKETETRIRNEEERLLSDFLGRSSKTYIDDEYLDLGAITYDAILDDESLIVRLYAIANKASAKKGLAPYYYQAIGSNLIYDTDKWNASDKVYYDENATGFIIQGESKNSLKLLQRDKEHKAKVDAENKEAKNSAVKSYFEKISGAGVLDAGSGTLNFKIPLDSAYDRKNNKFALKDSSGKVWAIKFHEFLERLKEVTNLDFAIDQDGYLYRAATEEEIKQHAADLKKQRDKEDEEFVKAILALKEEGSDSKTIEYGFVPASFNGSGYDSSSPVVDISRMYGILNKASKKAGYSPCYYQEQKRKKIFDVDKWDLGKFEIRWIGSSTCEWEKSDSIKRDEKAKGFYGEYYSNTDSIRIFRNDSLQLKKKGKAFLKDMYDFVVN